MFSALVSIIVRSESPEQVEDYIHSVPTSLTLYDAEPTTVAKMNVITWEKTTQNVISMNFATVIYRSARKSNRAR
jgi:hypothetical protein